MSARPIMVFHYPQPIPDDPSAGSGERVVRMLGAFREAGYEVVLVAGWSAERADAMRAVRRRVRAGERIAFVYSEATTNPTAMNDRHHLPLRPLLDARFLRFMRRHDVPVGLFYRDAHWQFDFYRVLVPAMKRLPARFFYLVDLVLYRIAVDVLFLPSRPMSAYLPGWRNSARVVELPPASAPRPFPPSPREGELDLFYVGSVAPPLYDLRPLITAVVATPGVRLTICCPVEQSPILDGAGEHSRITVVHLHGEALADHYRTCDIACLVYPHHPYRDFAMPVKLFEALGFSRPVLVAGGREANHFVRTSGTGWLVEPPSLQPMLAQLRDDPDARRDASSRAALVAAANTWVSRASLVADVLTACRAGRDAPNDRRLDAIVPSSSPAS